MSDYINSYERGLDTFRRTLMLLPPEMSHDLFLKSTQNFPLLATLWEQEQSLIAQQKYQLHALGLDWSFPVLLAAGMDKNAKNLSFFSQLLFGGVECGTVTWQPQKGNPRPRLFRLKHHQSLRNFCGLNNDGAVAVYDSLYHFRQQQQTKKVNTRIGLSLGKNTQSTDEESLNEYEQLMNLFLPLADYFVINLSSPNTPHLRKQQRVSFLQELALRLNPKSLSVPLLIKLAPDLEDENLQYIVDCIYQYGFRGIVMSNTTVIPDYGIGGISGGLLKEKARLCRTKVLKQCQHYPHFDIIGVGGIDCFKDLCHFWFAGGLLTQLYTAFVYQGPQMLDGIKTDIDQWLQRLEVNTLDEGIKFIRQGYWKTVDELVTFANPHVPYHKKM
jgi:dihydroorotate dehydrogenase